jgi:hypothetical protein
VILTRHLDRDDRRSPFTPSEGLGYGDGMWFGWGSGMWDSGGGGNTQFSMNTLGGADRGATLPIIEKEGWRLWL